MTFAYWMLLAAAVLPYVTVGFAKAGGIDNRAPRVDIERLSGWRKRADWAHRNHFEAFPPFAAAVIVAHLAGVPQERIDLVAGLFIVARIAYTGAYLADRATFRSLIWTFGIGCVVALFIFASLATVPA
jgi:uncharacterized MAPEG superfamily protein